MTKPNLWKEYKILTNPSNRRLVYRTATKEQLQKAIKNIRLNETIKPLSKSTIESNEITKRKKAADSLTSLFRTNENIIPHSPSTTPIIDIINNIPIAAPPTIIDIANRGDREETIDELIKSMSIFLSKNPSQYFIIGGIDDKEEIESEGYAITNLNFDDFKKRYEQSINIDEENIVGSDVVTDVYMKLNNKLTIQIRNRKEKNERTTAAFLPFLVKEGSPYLDEWKRYGIFQNIEGDVEACFKTALLNSDLSEEKKDKIRNTTFDLVVSLSSVKKISEDLEIGITIYKMKTRNLLKYGDKFKEQIRINYIHNHFFIEEETKCTAFAISHYNKVKHREDWNLIKSVKMDKEKKKFKKSSALMNLLFLHKHMEPINLDTLNLFSSASIKNFKKEKVKHVMAYNNTIRINTNNDKNLSFVKERFNYLKNLKEFGYALNDEQAYNYKKDKEIIKLHNKRTKVSINQQNKKYFFMDSEASANDTIFSPFIMGIIPEDSNFKIIVKGKECITKTFDFLIDKYGLYKKVEISKNNIKQKLLPIIYFHNLGYDIRQILQDDNLQKKIYGINLIEDGKTIYSAEFYYKGVKFTFRDSYKILPFKLSDLPKTLKLVTNKNGKTKLKKEVIPYVYYNDNELLKNNLRFDSLKNFTETITKEEDLQQLINNLYKWKLVDRNIKLTVENIKSMDNIKIDVIEYSAKYCIMDVKILKSAFLKWRKYFLDRLDIDIYDYLTIPTLAFNYFKNNGAFYGCPQLRENLAKFASQAVVGGKTMTNKNLMYKLDYKRETIKSKETHYEEIIDHFDEIILSDFDAVSLYPSAINRIKSLPVGKITAFNNNGKLYKYSLNNEKSKFTTEIGEKQMRTLLKNSDRYFIDIKVSHLDNRKHPSSYIRDFPLTSYLDKESGVRKWTDKLMDIRDIEMTLSDITIRELEKYYSSFEYEIIRGFYFEHSNENNPIFKDLMKNLFDMRVKMKKEKNPQQEAIKLLMNSAYGKLAQKERFTEKRYFTGKYKNNTNEELMERITARDNAFEFCDRNSKVLNKIYQVSPNLFCVEINKGISDYKTYNYIAAIVLDYSKQIMNEVLCLAEDLNFKIYYMDTDSIHIKQSQIKELEEEYKTKYNRELIGKEMGQFHEDFAKPRYNNVNIPSSEMSEISENNIDEEIPLSKNPVAIKTIIIGKKVYYDKLMSITKSGKSIFTDHIRIKGVSSLCISNDKLGRTPEEIYEDLFDKKKITFDICEHKPVFIYDIGKDGNFRIRLAKTFERTI